MNDIVIFICSYTLPFNTNMVMQGKQGELTQSPCSQQQILLHNAHCIYCTTCKNMLILIHTLQKYVSSSIAKYKKGCSANNILHAQPVNYSAGVSHSASSHSAKDQLHCTPHYYGYGQLPKCKIHSIMS